MSQTQQSRLLDFLKQEFDLNGSIHFLAVAAVEQQVEVVEKIKDIPDNAYYDGDDTSIGGIRYRVYVHELKNGKEKYYAYPRFAKSSESHGNSPQ